MKKVLILAGAGLLGFIIYKKYVGGSLQQPVSLTPYAVQPNLMGQPAMSYPFQAAQPQRADNSNQPWYQGNRNFIQPVSAGLSNFNENVMYAQGTASVVESVSSIWDNLSGIFETSSSPDTQASNTESFGGVDWSGLGFNDNSNVSLEA